MHKCTHTKTLSKHDLHCIHFYIQNVCKKSESGSLQVIVDHSTDHQFFFLIYYYTTLKTFKTQRTITKADGNKKFPD